MPKKSVKTNPIEDKELARKNEGILKEFLKEKLQKEQQNSAFSLHKLNEQWRGVLRQTRSDELQSDLEVLSQTCERMLTYKNSVIQQLVNDHMDAAQHTAQAWTIHLECMDRLLALQEQRLVLLQQQWDGSVGELNPEYNSKREHIVLQKKKASVYFKDQTCSVEQLYSDLYSELQENYKDSTYLFKNMIMEIKGEMSTQVKGKYISLQRKLQEADKLFQKAISHINLESLYISDQRSSQEIKTQMKRLRKLTHSISVLHSNQLSCENQREVAGKELGATKKEMTLRAKQLRSQFNQVHAKERSQLTTLVIKSNTAAKKLQGIVAKGEKILCLAKLCSKLETEHEKVLSRSTSYLQEQSQDNAAKPPSLEFANEMLDSAYFWQRYHAVLLEKRGLEREMKILIEDKKYMEDILRHKLGGSSISVSDNIHHQHQPLLTVAQQTICGPETHMGD